MSRITDWMDQTLYPQFRNNWDDDLLRERIAERLEADQTVLDLGAGAGIVEQTQFRGQVARMCGVDPDERVLENPFLDDAKVGVGEDIPYQENTFDVVFANNVLEHLENPVEVFSEIARVLKPGGRFLAKTPNRTHYVPLISACTPHWFHQLYNSKRGRDGDDTFPTHYKANSRSQLEAIAQWSGLELESVELIEGRPEYLRMFAPAYAAGWAYERVVNTVPGLSTFRVVLICTLRKPEAVTATIPMRAAA